MKQEGRRDWVVAATIVRPSYVRAFKEEHTNVYCSVLNVKSSENNLKNICLKYGGRTTCSRCINCLQNKGVEMHHYYDCPSNRSLKLAYTKESLKGKSISELRTLAKAAGLNPSGKNAADIVIELVKSGAEVVEEVEDKAPTAKKTSKKAAVKEEVEEEISEETTTADSLVTVYAVIAAIAKKIGAPDLIPAFWTSEIKEAKQVAGTKEAPEEGAEEPAESEDEDDSDDDEEEDAEVDEFDESKLAAMTLSELKEAAARIHKDPAIIKKAGKKRIDVATTSARELRGRIKAYLNDYAEVVEDDEEEEEEKPVCPSFIKVGAKVKFNSSEDEDEPEWVIGKVTSVDNDEGTCDIEVDDEEAQVPWESVKELAKKAKAK